MRQLILLSAFLFFTFGVVYSQTASLQTTLELKGVNVSKVPFQNGFPLPSFEKQKRITLDLSGTWKKKRFNADHNISLAERDSIGYLNLISESPEYYLETFDDSEWESKQIPFVENTMNVFPTVPEYYENGVWYRTSFVVDDSLSAKFVKLMFHSINYIADVWLNGEYLGWHEGGYTPFAFDISQHLKFGENNTLSIRVDNPPWGSRKDIVPFYKSDWFNYTGIIHDVYLEFSNQTSIIRADVVPKGSSGDFDTKIVIHNSSDEQKSLTAKIEVYEAELTETNISSEFSEDLISSKVLLSGSNESSFIISDYSTFVWNVNLNIEDPKLWSPQNPNLYILKISLINDGNIIDKYYSQFGLRSIQTSGNKVLLNNKVTFLTGVARHEDHPVYGRSLPKEIIFEDLSIIDTSNINYVRTSHYPNSPYTYLIADRLGLAIMEEIPVWWFDNEEEWLIQNNDRHIHEQMFREMVFKDYNRPSILFWSTSNECKEETNRIIYNQRIVDDLRNNYDDGRLITQSSAGDRPGAGDLTQDPLDIAGWTLYFGIFHGSTYYNGTLIFLTQASVQHQNKPIIDTEFGYWSSENNSSIQKQVDVFNDTFRALEYFSPLKKDGSLNQNGFLVGTTWWCVFDWYSHQHPNGFQSMGLVSMDRQTPKPVYEILKQTYAPYYSFGGMVLTDIESEIENFIINDYSLEQNFPNPFNPSTKINFSIPEKSNVRIELFNSIGEKVDLLFSGIKDEGIHSVTINGRMLTSGVYFCRMAAISSISNKIFSSTIKMILMK